MVPGQAVASLPAYLPGHRAQTDAVLAHGLAAPVKYVRLVRRRIEEGTVLLPSTICPPIVDELLWTSVRQIIAENKQLLAHRPLRDPEGALLARGHIFCGHCGRPALTLYPKDHATSPRTYRYVYAYSSKGKWVDDLERLCTLGFSHIAYSIDEWVWDYIIYLVSKADSESGQTLLEKIVANRGCPFDHQRLALESSLESAKEALKKEEAKRSNTEQAFQDALGRTYNQTHMDRLQTTLDSCDQKIAKYHETITSIIVQLQSTQEESDTKLKFLQQVRQLSQHIESADWLTKWLWLRILRIRVYVSIVKATTTTETDKGGGWRALA